MEETNYVENENMSMNQNTKGVENNMEQNNEYSEDFKAAALGGFLGGLGTGLSIGAVTTVGAIFIERRKRLALLAALQEQVKMAKVKMDNPKATTMAGGKKGDKSIDLTDVDVKGVDNLLKHIQDAVAKAKLRKSEQEKWNEVIQDIMKVTDNVITNELDESGKIISDDAVREDGKDNKIAK